MNLAPVHKGLIESMLKKWYFLPPVYTLQEVQLILCVRISVNSEMFFNAPKQSLWEFHISNGAELTTD